MSKRVRMKRTLVMAGCKPALCWMWDDLEGFPVVRHDSLDCIACFLPCWGEKRSREIVRAMENTARSVCECGRLAFEVIPGWPEGNRLNEVRAELLKRADAAFEAAHGGVSFRRFTDRVTNDYSRN